MTLAPLSSLLSFGGISPSVGIETTSKGKEGVCLSFSARRVARRGGGGGVADVSLDSSRPVEKEGRGYLVERY